MAQGRAPAVAARRCGAFQGRPAALVVVGQAGGLVVPVVADVVGVVAVGVDVDAEVLLLLLFMIMFRLTVTRKLVFMCC